MRKFLARGATVFTAGVVSAALSAASASAGYNNHNNDHGSKSGNGDLIAALTQAAGNLNHTTQSSNASVGNSQRNQNMPFSFFTVGNNGSANSWGNDADSGSDDCGCHNNASGTDGGSVHQGNSADNAADSTVKNGTGQNIDQTGTVDAANAATGYDWSKWLHDDKSHSNNNSGGHGNDSNVGDTGAMVDQDAGNDNSTDQTSTADIDNQQQNVNLPVSLFTVGSGGGDVAQGNEATNSADSTVANGTGQDINQTGDATVSSATDDGSGWHDDSNGGNTDAVVDQGAGNDNSTVQSGDATVSNDQSNVNLPVEQFTVGSGSSDVAQGNEATNTADSNVGNGTGQDITQTGDTTASSTTGDDGSDSHHDDSNGGDTSAASDQAAGNTNSTDQAGSATVDNNQQNINVPISVLSVGSNNGDVHQGNQATNTADSDVANGTGQNIDQNAGADAAAGNADNAVIDGHDNSGGPAATAAQDAGNSNDTVQEATSEITNDQVNINAPISVLSVDSNNGDVAQSNNADNSATSSTNNGTGQGITQVTTVVTGLIG